MLRPQASQREGQLGLVASSLRNTVDFPSTANREVLLPTPGEGLMAARGD
jgi:hypothetical protein